MGNSPKSVTGVQLSLLTTTATYALSTFKAMNLQSKSLLPNTPSRPLPPSMAQKFSIITATMVNSLTMHSSKRATTHASNSPSVALMPPTWHCCALHPDLSERGRKQLLHAHARWLQAVHFALWPYALRNAALLHNSLPVLEDGISRLELFSSIRVGCNMKHVHTFGCPVFALQNTLASGNQLPQWSPHARLGLNLGPSPMHARNVYLVLNLITGCVSPQHHCRFDNFFEATRHGGPDVSGTICWQQLSALDQATIILSEVSAPIQRSVMSPGTPSKDTVTLEELSVTPPFYEITSDDHSISDGDSQVMENVRPSCQSQASHQNEGATNVESTVTAGTSQCGWVHTMSQRMAESVAQGMHHMAHQSTIDETDEDLFHDAHLELQERM
jgi:hypothetical protein